LPHAAGEEFACAVKTHLTQSRKDAKGEGKKGEREGKLSQICFVFLCGFAALREVFFGPKLSVEPLTGPGTPG
jgi:hypothetical protein